MANSTADGSVAIDGNMNMSQAEKRLGKLRGDIKKTEKEIADMTVARDKGKQKSVFQAAKLSPVVSKLSTLIISRIQEVPSVWQASIFGHLPYPEFSAGPVDGRTDGWNNTC
nr:hypothetical protein [uncultured Oscillibacter sp.]